jgi:hypothetical protein
MASVFAVAAVMTFVMACYAHAFVFTQTLDSQTLYRKDTKDYRNYVYWYFSVPQIIDGDATLSLRFDGDFKGADKYADVQLYAADGIQSYTVGRVLDRDRNNDLFNFSRRDNPKYFSASSTATISEAEMAPLISNGWLVVYVGPSGYVDRGAEISGLISWDSPLNSTSVPEPPTIALCAIVLAVLGFVAWGRRTLA